MLKACNDAPLHWTCESVKGVDECNAYERHLTCDTGRLETYVLVSYCTPVCTISVYDGLIDYTYANGASTCSASTKRHVTRFLTRHGFNYSDIHTINSMCNGLPFDIFIRFFVNNNNNNNTRITGGEWLSCNLTPPTVTVGLSGHLDTYVPRFGFHNSTGYWIDGGKKAGFQCYTRI